MSKKIIKNVEVKVMLMKGIFKLKKKIENKVSRKLILTDSAGTGDKIYKNLKRFKFKLRSVENKDNKFYYNYDWKFIKQHGYAVIKISENNVIDNMSLINEYGDATKSFNRALGMYNDPSLEKVFRYMFDKENIIKQ